MRFSLRTLLLMFTAIAAAYLFSWRYLCNIYETQIDLKPISEELESLRIHDAWRKFSIETTKEPVLISDVKEWLSDSDFYQNQQLRPRAKERQLLFPRDHWGNPFVAVALNEAQEPKPQMLKSKIIGYFSLGQDGKSETYGNDPDDLNSWRPSTEYYLQQAKRQASDRARVEALWMAAIPLAMIWGVVHLFRDPHLAKKEEPQTA